jgi:Sulfatase
VSDHEPERQPSRLRELGVNFAHLAALSAFAVAQPLFDVLDESPDFFAVRGSSRQDIVLFALVVVFALPAALVAVEALASLVARPLERILHLLLVAVLAGTVVIQVLRDSTDLTSTSALIGLGAGAGVLAALLYRGVRPLRSVMTVLGLAPRAFRCNFLFVSPVSALTLAEEKRVDLADVEARAPVVMIVFDEFPTSSLLDGRGAIDGVRFPTFAELARGSTWFRNTTTVSYSTTQAVPAILTGVRPERGRGPTFSNYPNNIFTLLGGDYRMNVVESATHLCPKAVCKGAPPTAAPVEAPEEEPASLYSDVGVVYLHLIAPPRLAETLPPITETWMNFGRDEDEARQLLEQALAEGRRKRPEKTAAAPRRKPDERRYRGRHLQQYDRFVGSIRAGNARSLNLMHVMAPHGPWSYFPSGSQSSLGRTPAPGRDFETDSWVEPALALQAYQRHLLQAGFVDRLLGQLIDRLRATGVYDDALVVVTADHGVSFRVGESRRGATPRNLQDIAFVPLFVKTPGQRRGEIVDYHVQTVDILPTIADVLGITIPWRVDGRTALVDPRRATVRVQTRAGDAPGGEARAPFASLVPRHEALIRQRARLFGSGDWERLYAAGPHPELLARPASSFTVVASGDRAVIEDELTRELLDGMPPSFAFVPSPLQGFVEGPGAEAGRALAVAVNGRIAAIAETYSGSESVQFSALLPESAFRPGRNRIAFYWAEGSTEAVEQLAELGVG